MHFSIFAAAAAALASTVSAEVFKVSVGKEPFKFTPEFVDAKKGDTVMFIFHPKNHTLTQSSFGQPCENYTQGGLDSGFISYDPKEPPKSLQVWNVTVDDDVKPKWFSCRQRIDESSTHCSKGMVFSINPNNGKTPAGKPTSADGFKQLALASKPSVAAVEGSSSGSSSSSASSSGSASASATGSASKSDATSGSGSSSASDSKSASGSSSSSGTASASSGTAKATGTDTSSTAAQTDAGKPALPSSSSTPATSSSASSPAAASPTSAAGSLTRNTAGALTAVGIVLAFLL